MNHYYCTLYCFILLFVGMSSSWAQEQRHWINKNAQACATLAFECEENQTPFYTPSGCGCQKASAEASKQYYVNPKRETCLTLQFKCQASYMPFFDQQGCGCRHQKMHDCDNADKIQLTVPKYQRLDIDIAGISFEIPQNWFEQPQKMAWSPQRQGIPLLGFKWEHIVSDWEPMQILPQNSKFLGPYMIDLGWERGLLFLVQKQLQKSPQQQKNLQFFEIHVVIPRMEADIAYDFYVSAPHLEQLKAIEAVHQHFMHSGQLKTIKKYISRDVQACEEIELDCEVSEDEFFDDVGCGCMMVPLEEPIYDN